MSTRKVSETVTRWASRAAGEESNRDASQKVMASQCSQWQIAGAVVHWFDRLSRPTSRPEHKHLEKAMLTNQQRKARVLIVAGVLATVLAFAAAQSAKAGSTSISASGRSGTGASTFAQYEGWGYTISSCYYRYLYTTTFQSGGGYHDYTPTWATYDLQAAETDPSTNYVYSSHNVCTAGYASCNGYVNTSASR